MDLRQLIQKIMNTSEHVEGGKVIAPEVLVKKGQRDYKVKDVWFRGDNKLIIEVER